jgi:hypothetical protein
VIAPGTLAYYARKTGSVVPTGPAPGRRKKWRKVALLWGDPMFVKAIEGTKARVFAKGHELALPLGDLQEEPLLSIYQIDCGQGDAALVNFPDGRWMMVDGGPGRGMSNSGKIAADFLYWKAFVDQSWRESEGVGPNPFMLDAVVCTHPDADHFEGIADVTVKVREGKIAYGTVFHSGLGRFGGVPFGPEFSQLGPLEGSPDRFVTRLVDGFDDVAKYAKPSGSRRWTLAEGGYGDWLKGLRDLHGSGVGGLQRVSHRSGHLPGYGPAESTVAVSVLGPVEERKDRLRFIDAPSAFKSPSLTRNGHSVVLRLDYKRARILLTGDLNFRSHALLLGHHDKAELACHVAKACHHGSEDISTTFLDAMAPLATMVSSGDNETHAHPRARMLGLTGAFAQRRERGTQQYLGLKEKRLESPLIYSTELSRSVQLFEPFAAFGTDGLEVAEAELQATDKRGRRDALARWLLGDRLVYGLINVRTDGQKIVMAVMSEGDATFQLEELTV